MNVITKKRITGCDIQRERITSKSLYQSYRFDISFEPVILVSDYEIACIEACRFMGISEDKVRCILEFAKMCKKAETLKETGFSYNFYVFSRTRFYVPTPQEPYPCIQLGGLMSVIKDNLKDIEKSFDLFLKRQHCKELVISL